MINEEIRDLETRTELVNEKINIQDRFIEELTSQSDKKISEKQEEIRRLKDKKRTLSGQIDECFTTIETLEKMYTSPEKLQEKQDKLKTLSFQITSKKNLHARDLKFFSRLMIVQRAVNTLMLNSSRTRFLPIKIVLMKCQMHLKNLMWNLDH